MWDKVGRGTGLVVVALLITACGGGVSVTVPPGSGSLRIYVTDQSNNRIVLINDMTGTGWTTFAGQTPFNFPFGIFVDAAGKIYVADEDNNRITRFDDMTGTNWRAFGTFGSSTGQFKSPLGIFVNPASGKIYVTDRGNNRVVRLDDLSITGWRSLGGPAAGTGPGKFNKPVGIVVDGDFVYVADSGNNRIARFDDITSPTGGNWSTLSTTTCAPAGLTSPYSITFAGGKIYIADRLNNRILQLDSFSSSAACVSLGAAGSGDRQFTDPTAVFVGAAGKIYVVDRGNSRIARFDDMTGAGWTTFGNSGPNQFNKPAGIFVR